MGEAEELKAEVKAVLKKSQHPIANITREEQKALNELKEGYQQGHVDSR